MELFQDEGYKNSFRGSEVMLSLEQRLFVDVTLEAADPEVQLKVWMYSIKVIDDWQQYMYVFFIWLK